ncbi:hypothetical protein ACOMHN_053757 [Nucella lapillus]
MCRNSIIAAETSSSRPGRCQDHRAAVLVRRPRRTCSRKARVGVAEAALPADSHNGTTLTCLKYIHGVATPPYKGWEPTGVRLPDVKPTSPRGSRRPWRTPPKPCSVEGMAVPP